MELRHLRYFITVAEEENVTRAAARLHVAQPSLSRQIRDLEEELGVALFERTAKALRLTDAGRHFLEKAASIIDEVDEAVRSVREYAGVNRGDIHVGYAPSLATRALPAALASYQQRYPEMNVHLHDLSTEEMLTGIRDCTLGAALMARPSPNASDGIEFREVARFPALVAMRSDHPLAAESEIALSALSDFQKTPLLAYSRLHYPEYHTWLESTFGSSQTGRIVGEYDGSASLITAVESGRGIAIVQEGFDLVSGSRITLRPLAAENAYFSFGVAWKKDHASPLTLEFISVLADLSPEV